MPSGAVAPRRAEALAAYKSVLREVLDRRPSGTRKRLAEALGKNSSFISQISGPAYPVPVPPQHLPLIFEICRFSSAERESFLAAYFVAHPRHPVAVAAGRRQRTLTLTLTDLGDERRNAALDAAVTETAQRMARLMQDET